MIINPSLENLFKSIYERTDNKLLHKLAEQGKINKEYKNIRNYLLERIKNCDINTDDIDDFIELYNMPNQRLPFEENKLTEITTKLFLFYLREIKLPDNSLGTCLGEFYLEGTQFIDNMRHIIQDLKLNDKVLIISEHNNPYDDRAVKVLTSKNIKLGYLPGQTNYIPSYMLNNGNELFGFIKKLEWDEDNFSIKIMLYLN